MEKIKGFEDLKVWQKSHELVLEVYKVTQEFPNQENFGFNVKSQELFDRSEEIGKMLSGLINSLKNLTPKT